MYFKLLHNLLINKDGYDGRQLTRNRIIGVVLSVIFPGVPLYYVVTTPTVMNVTIATEHTLNVSADGYRIPFPDRSLFAPAERRNIVWETQLQWRAYQYLSYAGHTEGVAQKVEWGLCQMVYRFRSISLASKEKPTHVEGYFNRVTYEVVYSITELIGMEYLWEMVAHPALIFKNKTELAQISTTKTRTESWTTFMRDWDVVTKTQDGYRIFTLQALPFEHGLACF